MVRITVGRFIITSVSAPAISEVLSFKNSQKNSMPTSPYIMEGIPESVSAVYSMAAAILLFVAYSFKYIAAPTPSGSTITRVAITTYTLLSISGKMPMVSSSMLGAVDISCQEILGMPL